MNTHRRRHSSAEKVDRGRPLSRLLRDSHIFASAIRDILEVKFWREVCPHPMAVSQVHLLRLIAHDGTHQIGELASILGLTPPAATKGIDKLERLGLIVRGPCEGDRRATLLSASAKGRRLVEKYEKLTAERLAPVLGEFSGEDLKQLAGLLERFSLSLIRHENSSAELCLRCAAYCQERCPVGELLGRCPCERMLGSEHN